MSETDALLSLDSYVRLRLLLQQERDGRRSFKEGVEWKRGCSDVPSGRNMGCPTRREPHGYGAVIVVRPGEGPGQVKGPQDGWKPAGRRARCTKAKTLRLPAVIRRKSIWKATCMESVHAWFGEGRMKKGRLIGTSSAAYST